MPRKNNPVVTSVTISTGSGTTLKQSPSSEIVTAIRLPDMLRPCGFCGKGECTTQLIKKKGKGKYSISSRCPYRYERLRYDKTQTFDPTSKTGDICTNVPIYCPLCPPSVSGDPRTIWKYNAVAHLLIYHPDEPIPSSLFYTMHISKAEEKAMGVEIHVTEAYRDSFRDYAPPSDDIEPMDEDLDDPDNGGEEEEATQRGRSRTITTTTG